jgi:hypothetical protein|tara:strand:+ start:264 stop:482 length:219 start_codon:yes stop_codon:yes gene_type:complete
MTTNKERVLLRLKVGDMVRVRYPTDIFDPEEAFMGIIIETKDNGHVDRMWCFKTHSTHIINRINDEIEVLNR